MKLHATLLAGVIAMLSACAGDGVRNEATLRPAERPECQVASSSSAATLARSDASAMVRDPCHPEQSLEWSAGRGTGDTIKPDFSGKHD